MIEKKCLILILASISNFFFAKSIDRTISNYVGSTSDSFPTSSHQPNLKIQNYSTLLVAFSTSFTENKNWQTVDYKNYSFIGNMDYTRKTTISKFKQLYQFRGELGFLKFVDSTWYKNSDNLNVYVQWTDYSSKKFTHSYSIILKSQFADTWRYKTNRDGKATREWRGGFLNPATLMLAYGLNYDFWQRCFVSFAFATVKVNSRPRYDDALLPTEKELARTEKYFIISEYGMSVQGGITKNIYDNVFWTNKTQFFSNGINKNQVTVDFQNRFTFVFLKYLQFRADTHIVYDPLYSYSLQYRQEFLVGVFFEKRK
ncbi:MAG: hypothetical protein NT126_13030 [Bacteroidetes bacterium]|nr:hypothetical protein [Bacteroidota bacterium]